MKTLSIISAAAIIAATSFAAVAMPTIEKPDPNKVITVSELKNRMGKFDANDIADLAMAGTVSFYHVPDFYDFDDYATAYSAMDTTSMRKLQTELAADPEVAKLYESRGYAIIDTVAVVHNPAQKHFDIYLR